MVTQLKPKIILLIYSLPLSLATLPHQCSIPHFRTCASAPPETHSTSSTPSLATSSPSSLAVSTQRSAARSFQGTSMSGKNAAQTQRRQASAWNAGQSLSTTSRIRSHPPQDRRHGLGPKSCPRCAFLPPPPSPCSSPYRTFSSTTRRNATSQTIQPPPPPPGRK